MSQKVREVMTPDPVTLSQSTSVVEGAKKMRDLNIGGVIVLQGDTVCGIVTDRDIVVRAVASGADLTKMTLGGICSKEVAAVSPNDDVEQVTALMREKAVRRVPVVDNGKAAGIVSMGDLALARDEKSVLANVSGAPPNR